MERRSEATNTEHVCVACDTRDQRMLTTVELASGKTAILCGSHALLYRRAGSMARSVGDLRASLEDRRETSRRREGGGDELGDRLVAAFTRDRRSAERRA